MTIRKRDEVLSLSRVLGSTTLHSSALVTSSTSDHIFYAAGSIAVRYSPLENEQKGFYASTGKAISCLAISADSRYLAIGERGHLPSIVVWDLIKQQIIHTLTGHKHGISSITFSTNQKYIISCGFKPDKQLIVWERDTGKKLSTQRLGNKVYSIHFHPTQDCFITAGDRHLKWWYMTEIPDFETIAIEGKPASIIEDMKTSIFQDITFGYESTEGKVYCITSTGMLCVFNEERIVEKWVQVELASAYTLDLHAHLGEHGMIFVGGSHGIIRVYDAKTLELYTTLPYPVPLYEDDVERHEYAACYALRLLGSPSDHQGKLTAIYADRSIIVWDIMDLHNISTYRSFTGHRSCIWDIQFVEQITLSQSQTNPSTAVLPLGTFVTCSSDNSVRLWNLDAKSRRSSKFKSKYSRELLQAIHFEGAESTEDNSEINDSKSLIASTATGLSITNAKGSTEFDFVSGIPDLEVPNRSQSPTAPRVLAIHPFGFHIAIGDKSGKLRVYDLRTMKCVFMIQAHAAEILTVSFSPPLVTYDHGKTWSLQSDLQEIEVDGDTITPSKPLVLLATAGRDRLIHIFDASTQEDHYSPIDTLDHHSSSVTIVKFTSDGKRLISCGGDKQMIFHAVNGPQITKFKEIPTPQGTINGLAVEASNKFAVTSGQDKRLNIWNVHSGKFMRAHKSAEINTELYKTDLDPSGSYIATCSFDKNITMVDFFSGDILCQVSGHSELVTGMKFSPDGRFLVTVGGEGCIMVWKVSDYVVKTMRDRLIELYTNAQRRNTRAVIRQSSMSSTISTQSSATSSSVAPSVPASSAAVAPAASLVNLKQRLSRNNNATQDTVTSMSSSADGLPRKNRWQSNLDKDAGYELFGKKVIPEANNNKNKFTLELTSAPLLNEKTMLPVRKSTTTDGNNPSESEESAGFIDGPSQVAINAENADEVMQGASSDEEDDGSYLFPKKDEYESDFEQNDVDPSAGVEDDETRASKKLDSLEKSASDLESWLEEMLRNETKLDNPAVEETNDKKVNNPILNQSLSSAFFRGVRSSSNKPTPGPKETGDDLLPPAPIMGKELNAEEREALINERKLRESAATMAQMRERIRAMEVREQDSASSTPHDLSTSGKSFSNTDNQAQASSNTEFFMPPPPPSIEEERKSKTQLAEDDDEKSLFKTPSSASDNEDEDSVRLSTATSLRGSVNGIEDLKAKTKEYRKILSELEKAKEKAAASFQELLSIRSSLSTSTFNASESVVQPSSSSVLMESMKETDLLLEQFRRSLANVPNIANSSTTAFAPAATASSELSGNELTAFLDKYSDKLADMVGEKILARMSLSK